VLTHALATRILFDGNRATGVEIVRNGQREAIRADSEVILAAGAYNSPQLLLLSGIGPAADLAVLQIAVRHDLPVGLGLQDHPLVMMCWYTDTESMMTPPSADDFALWESDGRGPLSSNGGETGGFFRTRADLDVPDVQFLTASLMLHEQCLSPPRAHAASFGPCVLKPKSRGKVSLRSADATAKPQIVHNYLVEPEDRQTIIDAIRLGLDIASQPAMRAHIREPYLVPKSGSDADIWRFAADYAVRLPPDEHVRDRSGGRQQTPRARRAEAARRRRLGDAKRGARQHQCAHHHDCRTCRGFDPWSRLIAPWPNPSSDPP
jgi:choline dehydrogenase